MPKVVFKFQDDPTVNKSGIIVLLGHVWVYAEKKGFWKRKKGEGIWEEERAENARRFIKTTMTLKRTIYVHEYSKPIIYLIFFIL